MDKQSGSNQPDAHARYRRGMNAFNRFDYATAAKILEQNLDGDSMSVLLSRYYAGRSRFRLGMADLNAGQFQTAAAHFKRAREHNPNARDLSRYLVACYTALHDHAEAAEECQAALAETPDDENERIRSALALWRLGRRKEAIDTLQRGIEMMPAEPELHSQLATLLAACGRYDQAILQFNTANTLRPNHCDTLIRLAWCHAARSDLLRAFELLREAFGLRPHDPDLALQLTLAARAVRQIHPDLALALPTETASKEDPQVVAQLTECIVRDPDFAEALLGLETTDADREVVGLLAAAIESALRRCPEHADLHYHASRVYERLGQAERAIRESQRAIDINPRYTRALIQLAKLYAATSQNQAAIDRLRQAILAGAEYPDLHYMLGNIYKQSGKTDDARDAFQRAVQLNETHQPARDALDELLHTRGQ